MMKINKHRLTIYCIIFLATLDIITRNNAQLYFDPNKTIWIIKGMLGFTYRINYGGMFGFARNWRFIRPLNISLRFIFLMSLFIYYSKLHSYLNLLLRSFFVLFTACALGGLPDPILLGYNRDWIVWFGLTRANLGDLYLFISFTFLLPVGLILHPKVTWKSFKKWLFASSIKETFGSHLFKDDNNV